MQIRNKSVLVYDVEVFQNIFHCLVKNSETGEIHKFEISKRKNQLQELVDFFWTIKEEVKRFEFKHYDTPYIFVGYNNHHFDDVIINYMIDYHKAMNEKTYLQICTSIYNLKELIIHSKDEDKNLISKWKYMKTFESFDLLTMLYSQKLRVSLKDMQVTMQYRTVQEFVHDWNAPLPVEDIDEMIVYNLNDVESTEELLNRSKADIELRIGIEDEYKVSALSKDGVNIGMEILKQKYLEKSGLNWWDVKDLRSPVDYIPLKDVILPFVEFKHPLLQGVLKEMKEQTVSPGRKGYENNFIFGGLRYTVGVGGIHSKNSPEIIIPKDDEMLIDIDVASLYPSMLIEYDFYPKHLGPEFLEVYSQIKDERMEAKHNGEKIKNETLKLALNGLSGNLQNEHSFCYSPFAVMQIRINGQLLLLMLAEKLVELGCRIVQANTDGLFVLLKKDVYNKLYNICREWEQLTHLVLEEERFESMFQYAINDYIAVKEGYTETKNEKLIKKKGIFITDVLLGKGLSPKIIPEAIIRYFVDGIPVDDTIHNCTDIRKFLMSEKTGKQWTVEYNNENIQRTNRFYASTDGAYLWKWKSSGYKEGEIKHGQWGETVPMPAKFYQNMLSSSGVTLLNEFDEKLINERKINYRYYLRECYKIVEELKPRQLSLF